MKIVYSDYKKGRVQVRVENSDDLWCLLQIIEPGDTCIMKTFRKIKLGSEPNIKIIKKSVVLELLVEKVDYSEFNSVLRVSGIIKNEVEDIPKGKHHTFSVDEGSLITIIKSSWLDYFKGLLNEFSKPKKDFLAVIFDREKALFVDIKNNSYKIISSFNVDVKKKDVEVSNTKSENIFKLIVKKVQELDSANKYIFIIFASANFWRQYIESELTPELKKKSVFSGISSVSPGAINELLKRPELQKILSEQRVSKELAFIDKLLFAISKDIGHYGFDDVKASVLNGNVKFLIVSNNLIMSFRQSDSFNSLRSIMKTAQDLGAEIHVVSSNQAVKKLDSLGGIGSISRW